MQSGLRLTLLGTPQVWLDNFVVHGFRTAKTQALFFYLAVTRHAYTRAALATFLWGDMPERNAHVSLSKSLSNLRDLFPAYLEIDRHLVAFNSHAPYWLDVAAFEAGFAQFYNAPQIASPHSVPTPLYDEAGLRRLRQVVDLYDGDFLSGFAVNNAPDFDAWQSTEGQRLRELAIQTLDRLATGYAELGNWGEAIACCRKILTLEAWREETHRQVMRLLVAAGQRSAALAQYELCVRTLDDELAVEPEHETIELYDSIVAGTVAVDGAANTWKAQISSLKPAEEQHKVTHPLPNTHAP